MKKIVPFQKEIMFKTNLSEITSISLEHSLHLEEEHLISGEFIISGEYLINENSMHTEAFSFNIPFDINMDDKYVLDKAVIDINDFYYEIINSQVLLVNIEVSIDKLEEKSLLDEIELVNEKIEVHDLNKVDDLAYMRASDYKEATDEISDTQDETSSDITKINLDKEEENMDIKENRENKMPVSKEDNLEKRCIELEDEDNNMKSLFDDITNEEEYATYKICIVRQGDSLESIMLKYDVTKEQMEIYNDLSDIKIGDKLIIPSVKH